MYRKSRAVQRSNGSRALESNHVFKVHPTSSQPQLIRRVEHLYIHRIMINAAFHLDTHDPGVRFLPSPLVHDMAYFDGCRLLETASLRVGSVEWVPPPRILRTCAILFICSAPCRCWVTSTKNSQRTVLMTVPKMKARYLDPRRTRTRSPEPPRPQRRG